MATQAERSAATRTKLLDATAACLAEVGYNRTSTTEVCRRAGVSRGAQLHHFPTKAELVAAAVDHIFERRVDEFRVLMETLPSGPQRIGLAVDVLWSMFQGETFAAWFELAAAGRTDPELAPHVQRVGQAMSERIHRAWLDLFPPPPGQQFIAGVEEAAPAFLFTVLDGLAMRKLTGMAIGPDEPDMVLGAIKFLATSAPLYEPQEKTQT
jgi:AcrR family transcriptional regulator